MESYFVIISRLFSTTCTRDVKQNTEYNNCEFESQWGFCYKSTANGGQSNQISYTYLITYDNSWLFVVYCLRMHQLYRIECQRHFLDQSRDYHAFIRICLSHHAQRLQLCMVLQSHIVFRNWIFSPKIFLLNSSASNLQTPRTTYKKNNRKRKECHKFK